MNLVATYILKWEMLRVLDCRLGRNALPSLGCLAPLLACPVMAHAEYHT